MSRPQVTITLGRTGQVSLSIHFFLGFPNLAMDSGWIIGLSIPSFFFLLVFVLFSVLFSREPNSKLAFSAWSYSYVPWCIDYYYFFFNFNFIFKFFYILWIIFVWLWGVCFVFCFCFCFFVLVDFERILNSIIWVNADASTGGEEGGKRTWRLSIWFFAFSWKQEIHEGWGWR